MCERAAQLVAGVLGDLPVGQRVRILPHRYACRSVLFGLDGRSPALLTASV
jgi:hypothetical protein